MALLMIRLATAADLPAIERVMERAIAELQKPFLDPAQIAASRRSMGLDTTLVADGTYFCVLTATGVDGKKYKERVAFQLMTNGDYYK